MSKQDRQGVRQASDLEQKYNFGKSFAEVMGIATDAQKKADEAKDASSKPAENLTHDEVLDLLTNNDTLEGLYRGDNGELYINATYIRSGELLADLIKTGTLASKDGTVKVDLNNNCVTIDGTRNGYKTQIVLSSSGLKGYGANTIGELKESLQLSIGVGNLPTSIWNHAWGAENTGLSIGTAEGVLDIGDPNAETTIYGKGINLVSTIAGEREYFNPPMKMGVEYRTAEYWNGKPVYTKLIDCGAMGNKNLIHGLGATHILSAQGEMSGLGASYAFPYHDGTNRYELSASTSRIYLTTTVADASAYTVTAVIRYVKD